MSLSPVESSWSLESAGKDLQLMSTLRREGFQPASASQQLGGEPGLGVGYCRVPGVGEDKAWSCGYRMPGKGIHSARADQLQLHHVYSPKFALV